MCKYPALWSDVEEDGGGGSCGKMDRNGDCRGRCGRCGGVGGGGWLCWVVMDDSIGAFVLRWYIYIGISIYLYYHTNVLDCIRTVIYIHIQSIYTLPTHGPGDRCHSRRRPSQPMTLEYRSDILGSPVRGAMNTTMDHTNEWTMALSLSLSLYIYTVHKTPK